ncbi:MAG TPA: hypothetical protein VFF41_03075 [Gallionella sp.]|nr:hypothetical protein [Gallionella sp.]
MIVFSTPLKSVVNTQLVQSLLKKVYDALASKFTEALDEHEKSNESRGNAPTLGETSAHGQADESGSEGKHPAGMMTLTPNHSETLKTNPFLSIRYEPYTDMTDQEWMDHRELVRRQHVALFCLSPSYQRAAKNYPDGEQAYWSRFSVGGIHLLPETSTPFSPEELMQMSYMEIVEKAQALDRQNPPAPPLARCGKLV